MPTIEDAYRKAVTDYGHRTQITGIDIGPKYKDGKKTGDRSIRFHVVVKRNPGILLKSEAFPTEIDGYPVDVLPRNYVPAIEGARNGATSSGAAPSLQPGLSVSHRLCPSGTLGLFVRDVTDDSLALLTNWHILADSSFARIGDPILQPGGTDGGTNADDIATLRRTLLGKDGDAAIATLNNSRPMTMEIPGPGLNRKPTGVRDPIPGETVIKCGRTTGVTEGIVEGIGTYFPIYRTRDRVPIEGFEIVLPDRSNPANLEISANGDSGSAIIAKTSNDLVGILFAGERDQAPQSEIAIACFASRVFSRLEIALP
jgi:endonuclease G